MLVSSAWKGKTNIMTMGWHMVMGFEPSLIGCYIWDQNHSFGMIKGSKECAINIPTFDIARQVVGIGNCSGADVDKFAKFKLTPVKGAELQFSAGQGVLRQFRVQGRRHRHGRQVQPLRPGSRQSAGSDLAQGAAHHPLSRRRPVHGLRKGSQFPNVVSP